MKDWDGIIILLAVALVAGLLFWGIRFAVGKSFKSRSSPFEDLDSRQKIESQKNRARDTLDRQRQLMRDQQQKLEDYRRKQ